MARHSVFCTGNGDGDADVDDVDDDVDATGNEEEEVSRVILSINVCTPRGRRSCWPMTTSLMLLSIK